MQEEIKSFLKYSKFFTEIQTYILHFLQARLSITLQAKMYTYVQQLPFLLNLHFLTY
jgi:hypothetical protein